MGLDLVEVMLMIEDEFAISFPENCPDFVTVVTVQDLAEVTIKRIRDQSEEEPDPDAVLARTVQIVEGQLGRWFGKTVTPEARLRDVLSM